MSKLSLKWQKYAVELQIQNRVVGGIPTSPNLIEGWLKAHMPLVSEDERATLAAKTADELPQATEEKAQGMWTTFKTDDEGPYLESRNVKAALKEAANILRSMLEKGEKKAKDGDDEKKGKSRFTNLRSKLAERVFVDEDKLHFLDGKNKKLVKVDGNEERAIHVMTAMGPRNALKRYDYIDGGRRIRFTLKVLDDGLVDEELLAVLLEYAGQNGLGADRSQGNGLFEVKRLQAL